MYIREGVTNQSNLRSLTTMSRTDDSKLFAQQKDNVMSTTPAREHQRGRHKFWGLTLWNSNFFVPLACVLACCTLIKFSFLRRIGFWALKNSWSQYFASKCIIFLVTAGKLVSILSKGHLIRHVQSSITFHVMVLVKCGRYLRFQNASSININ